MSEWIKSTFDINNQLYEKVFVPTAEVTEREAQFITEFTGVSDTKRILDIGCGSGRHVEALTRMGYMADGIDNSNKSIENAKKRLNAISLGGYNPQFYLGDIRYLNQQYPQLQSNYDLAINMFSSFGYYDDDYEQVAVLNGIYASLVEGGMFLLDIPNKNYVLSNFEKYAAYQHGDLDIEIYREFNSRNSMITTDTLLSEGEKTRRIRVRMKLYDYDEIQTLLRNARFELVKTACEIDGTIFNPEDTNCKRLITLSQKK